MTNGLQDVGLSRSRAVGLLILLSALWGGGFALIRIAVASTGPVEVALGRLACADVLLWAVVLVRRISFPRQRQFWRMIVVLGLTGNAAPFFLISLAEQSVSGGMAAITMGLVPATTLILAFSFGQGERISLSNGIALVTGFGAITLLFLDAAKFSASSTFGLALLLASALLYSLSLVLARCLHVYHPIICAAGASTMGAIWLFPVAMMSAGPQWFAVDSVVIIAIVALGVLSTALAAMIFFTLTAQVGAGFTSLNAYLVPLFGLIIGAIWLGEKVSAGTITALIAVLATIYIARWQPRTSAFPTRK